MPSIFYWAWAHNNPTGGQKQIYRHVDLLGRAGHQVRVVHPKEGFRITWFANDTPVIGPAAFAAAATAHDFVVVPEDAAPRFLHRLPGRKVIFNQNLYYGFRALTQTPQVPCPYLDPNVAAVFAVSEHNRRSLELAFPRVRVIRLRYGIDGGAYSFVPLESKRPRIVTIRKAASTLDVDTVHQVLSARAAAGHNALGRFEWTFIDKNSEAEVQRFLGEGLLLLFLNVHEGFGLLPIEAMSRGCLLAVQDAGPLRESVPEQYRFAPGDVPAVVDFIEAVAAAYPGGLDAFAPLVARGRAAAAAFSLDRERESLLAAWDSLLRS